MQCGGERRFTACCGWLTGGTEEEGRIYTNEKSDSSIYLIIKLYQGPKNTLNSGTSKWYISSSIYSIGYLKKIVCKKNEKNE